MANLGDNLKKDATSLVSGISRGLTTDLLGAPVDIVAATMRGMGVPIPDEPKLGSKHLRRLTNQPLTDNPVETIGTLLNPAATALKGAALAGIFMRAPIETVYKADRLKTQGLSDKQIYDQTGAFGSAKGNSVRTELADTGAQFQDSADAFLRGKESSVYGKVKGLVSHNGLLNGTKVGEDIGNMNLIMRRGDHPKGIEGLMDPQSNTIEINLSKNSTKQEAMATILHEMQHVVQMKQGMHQGASPDNILDEMNAGKLKGSQALITKQLLGQGHSPESISELLYWNMAGEVEARAVAARYGMSYKELMSTVPTYDVPASQVLTK